MIFIEGPHYTPKDELLGMLKKAFELPTRELNFSKDKFKDRLLLYNTFGIEAITACGGVLTSEILLTLTKQETYTEYELFRLACAYYKHNCLTFRFIEHPDAHLETYKDIPENKRALDETRFRLSCELYFKKELLFFSTPHAEYNIYIPRYQEIEQELKEIVFNYRQAQEIKKAVDAQSINYYGCLANCYDIMIINDLASAEVFSYCWVKNHTPHKTIYVYSQTDASKLKEILREHKRQVMIYDISHIG